MSRHRYILAEVLTDTLGLPELWSREHDRHQKDAPPLPSVPLKGQSFPQPSHTSSTAPLKGQVLPQSTTISSTTPLKGQVFPQSTASSSTTPLRGQVSPQPADIQVSGSTVPEQIREILAPVAKRVPAYGPRRSLVRAYRNSVHHGPTIGLLPLKNPSLDQVAYHPALSLSH